MCKYTWSQNRQYGHIDNIRLWMYLATMHDWQSGMSWYPDANEFVEYVVSQTGIDKRIVSAVLSALSPQNPWERNKQDCESLVKHYASGGRYDDAPKVCTFDNNKQKAWQFLTGHTWKNGNKTTAFVDNISFPLTSTLVTVDIWAVRVWLNNSEFGTICEECTAKAVAKWEANNFCNSKGKPCSKPTVKHGPSLTDSDYETISDAYTVVANEYGIRPLECQAIVWVAMKNAVGR